MAETSVSYGLAVVSADELPEVPLVLDELDEAPPGGYAALRMFMR
jgi:hypothetical protein